MDGFIVIMTNLLAAVLLLICISACSPIYEVRGYAPASEDLEKVKVGYDTPDSVRSKLGMPSTVSGFDNSGWYYIERRIERGVFRADEVTEQRVVAVIFDNNAVVASVDQYGLEDGRIIDLVSRTTPASGKKLSILQQIFGNLGRFNVDSDQIRR